MEDKPEMHPPDGLAVGLSARAADASSECERLVVQLREANEQLALATVRADELAEAALAAQAKADEIAALEAEGRRRAEALAEQLLASEAALRASESQFQTLANTVPMLVWYANPDGHIAWYNQPWYDYTGTTLHEQVGWRWQSVVAPGDLQRIVARWSTVLASGEPWEDTFRLRRHDGEFRWFLSRARPLRDVTGRIVRWFGTAVDIDDQKRAEVQARASNPADARKVLVVDDNREAAELIAVSLAALGHEVRTAFDGPSALGVVGSFVPDVALLDIGLPVMDGYELASRLRTLLSPRDIRFVAITGYGDAADHRRSQEAGFAMHLVKPVDVLAIQDSVRGGAVPPPPAGRLASCERRP